LGEGAAAGYSVFLMPVQPPALPSDRGLLLAVVDAGMRFSFNGLAPGAYRLAVQGKGARAGRLLPEDLSKMFEIEVAGGSTTSIELPVPRQ
jgi:hypothetical protein